MYPVSFWTRFQILVGFATPGIWTLLMDDMAGSKWLLVIGNSSVSLLFVINSLPANDAHERQRFN